MADSKNIDKALTYLGSTLKSIVDATPQKELSLIDILKAIPKNGLPADRIDGAVLKGIKDTSTSERLTITDAGITADNITVTTLKADIIEVKEIKTSAQLEKFDSIEFKTDIVGKGLLWTGEGYTKQFVLRSPDRFFSSENIDLNKDKSFSVNGISVLSASELGSTVTKSSLREVGRLKGLIVDGSVSINQYIYYNSTSSRLGIGTEEPNAGLSVAEDGIEVMIGSRDASRGMIGTFASHSLDIVTGDTPWISISPSGNIQLGNTSQEPVQVSISGKLAVKVAVPDPNVDLHVAGPIRFHGHLHIYADEIPTAGSYKVGDIIWNNAPRSGKSVGWVCTVSGSPGVWNAFGLIN